MANDLYYVATNVTLSDAQKWTFAMKLAFGLEHMHKNNIIHRDIKGNNVVVRKVVCYKFCCIRQITNLHLYIGDFGLAQSKIFQQLMWSTTLHLIIWHQK